MMADITGTEGNDNLNGTAGDDTIDGRGGDDTLNGGGGDDGLVGGPGADTLDGGPGDDVAVYLLSLAGVTIDLSATPDAEGYVRGSGGDAEGDRLKNIEALAGSDHADRLTGDDNDNGLWGFSGADTLDGGGGVDWAAYLFSSAGVTIDLSATPDADGYIRGAGGNAEGDRLKNIENLQGSAYDDRLTGDDNDNGLWGFSGADTLAGGGGADTLDGGDGEDRASYSGSATGVTIDLSATPDADGYVRGSGGDAEGDRLKNIEDILGSNYDDRLTGDDGSNDLAGGPGADTLDGGDGWDDIYGGPGADTLDGGDGWDDLYGGPGADTLDGGPGFDKLEGGPGADTLDGGAGGRDDAIYSSSAAGVTINLSATPDADGYIRGAGGDAEGDRLRNIEDLWGSAHSDRLTGDYNDNWLYGLGGDDTLNGGPGDDDLDGWSGDDTLNGGDGSDELYGGSGADTLDGGPGNDRLRGDDGADTLDGGPDNDLLIGDDGADTLDGGPGVDRAVYWFSAAGVTIDLSATPDADGYVRGAGGDAQGDRLKNIENLEGSAHADRLTGDGDDNWLSGGSGDDTLNGGPGDDYLSGWEGDDTLNGGPGNDRLTGGPGSDTLGGGPGVDRADYWLSAAGVTIDLSATPDADGYVRGAGGDAEGDRLKNIEDIRGSGHDDRLTGDGKDNELDGWGGDDTLNGGPGNDDLDGGFGADTLNGGPGEDTLTGGAGADTLIGGGGNDWLSSGYGADTLDGGPGMDRADYRLFSAEGVTINLSATPDADGYVRGTGGHAEGDRLKNIENLTGSFHADRLTGDDNNNDLDGSSGNDTLTGGPGDDTLTGGAGDDFLGGNDGADTLDGGPGVDRAEYWLSAAGVTIDLSAMPDAEGYVRGIGGEAEGDRLKNIEDLLGSDHADRLTGDDNDNWLWGFGGDDTLNGGPGNDELYGDVGADTLDGGPGVDRADYWLFSTEGVTIDLSATPDADGYVRGAGGEAEGDRLRNIENILGSDYDDRLTGDDNDNWLLGAGGDDTLSGGPGDDYLEGWSGNDTLNGGPGDDELTGDGFLDGADRFVFDAGSGRDTITDFELGVDTIHLSEPGTAFADLRIEANGGNARVSWGDAAQSITLTGIAGTDLTESSFLFSDATQPDAGALTGTAGNDALTGTAGDDTLNGLAGDDTLTGGAGADALNGGPGADTADYSQSDAGVLVRLHDAHAAKYGHAEGDTLTDVEHLIGSQHNDTLAGDGGDNRLAGGDGDDVLYGGPGGGDDLMDGGNGDDRLFGGQGADTLSGGAGYDSLRGGPGDDVLIADGDDMDALYGGPGRDTFQFSPSNLGGGSIRDFSDGEDVIDLTAFIGIDSMDDLDITSHGDNVRVELSGSDYLTTIILSGFDINNLDNSDFLF